MLCTVPVDLDRINHSLLQVCHILFRDAALEAGGDIEGPVRVQPDPQPVALRVLKVDPHRL